MPIDLNETLRAAWIGLRDFMQAVFIVGCMQVLISILVWPIVFHNQPLGFSMALSAVGFGSWVLSFVASFGGRRRLRGGMMVPSEVPDPSLAPIHPLVGLVQGQVQRAGCGFVLLCASLIPLGIALILRVRADLRTGLTLRDIFPPM
jgi:hypothetical protein